MKLIVIIVGRFLYLMERIKTRYMIYLAEKKCGCKINFVEQGTGGLRIGNPENFKIDITSHLKSNCFIECQGGVTIGKYFHTGRGLTIFSSNHNYLSKDSIPYDNEVIKKPVIIHDCVWIGANVTICPGVIM